MSEPFVEEQDKELLERARQGEAEAFCALAQAHEQRLFQQAVALCHNPATAEDLAAETLIEAWKSIGRFDGSCRFSTWLYAILLHRHQKHVRKQRSRPVPLSMLPVGEAKRASNCWNVCPIPSPCRRTRSPGRTTTRVCAEPSRPCREKHRQVVQMRFFEDASVSEIAGALGFVGGHGQIAPASRARKAAKNEIHREPFELRGDT